MNTRFLSPLKQLLPALVALGLALPGLAAPKKVLVVTTTTGFRHSSIETAEKVLEKLGKESGAFTVEFARVTPPVSPRKPGALKADASEAEKSRHLEAMTRYEQRQAEFKKEEAAYKETQMRVLAQKMSPVALKNYDGVIFANTTGDLPLPDKQAFINWVKDGHAFIGMHSASDTFHNFKPYVEMIGGEFQSHGAQAGVDCLNEDAKHPACKHLESSWGVFDEIYILKSFERSTVHMLLGLDKEPNKKTEGYFPVAWCKEFGKGRVFYTSLGHREDVWDDELTSGRKNTPEVAKAYQQHILGGIKWALGLEKGDAKPQTAAK
jgi:type 1 glutamine amidotransferase